MNEDAIIAVLRTYKVAKHWRASSEAKTVRYAVFVDGKPVTTPAVHGEAEAARERLVAQAILRIGAPYGPMCRDPQLCAGRGYCPRDPTCGD